MSVLYERLMTESACRHTCAAVSAALWTQQQSVTEYLIAMTEQSNQKPPKQKFNIEARITDKEI